MLQQTIDSLAIFVAYSVLIPSIYFLNKKILVTEKAKEVAKDAGKQSQILESRITAINSPQKNPEEEQKVGFLSLFQYSKEELKQNKQDFQIRTQRIGQFMLYLSNNLMILSILNGYHGIDDFNQSFWLLGFVIAPIYNLIQLVYYLIAYVLAQKILKKTLIKDIDQLGILIGYFYFILGNLIIVSSINCDDFLIDKAFSLIGLQYIIEIVLNHLPQSLNIDILEKINGLLQKK